MIDAGLDKLCHDGLEIVPIHFYSWQSSRLAEFKSQIARLPLTTRIWVTETNDMPPRWDYQIGYVEEIYPKLRKSLRAERIYWYVFSMPPSSFYPYQNYSLVAGLAEQGEVEYSPLMNELISAPNDELSIPDQNESSGTIPPSILRYPKDSERNRDSNERRKR